MAIADGLKAVTARIHAACQRAGRPASEVRLVAVTKYAQPAWIRALLELGVADLGENRPQQLAQRREEFAGAPAALDDAADGPRWHMIGHLQRNKIKLFLRHSRILHSLDSLRLAEELAAQARDAGPVDVLIEVNVSGEASKGGVTPAEAPRLAEAVAKLTPLRLRGLMTMAPLSDDPQSARPVFARLRELRDTLRRAGAAGPDCHHLSMGMSNDFDVAIEEGATLIRVGSALFEGVDGEPA